MNPYESHPRSEVTADVIIRVLENLSQSKYAKNMSRETAQLILTARDKLGDTPTNLTITMLVAEARKVLGQGDNQNKEKKVPPTKKKKNEEEEEDQFKHVSFVKEGHQIILPEGMEYDRAIIELNRKIQEEETMVSIHEEINAFPLDGAYALMLVLRDKYGWASPVPTPGFFGPKPPVMKNVEIDFGVHTQCFWGGFAMPGIEGQINTGVDEDNGKLIFVISGTVKKKHQEAVREIAQKVRDYVKLHSIYKGKAIRLRTDEDGDLSVELPPVFIDISRVKEEELVLPKSTYDLVEANLFTPIEKTEACRQFKIPLKRSIALEGPFGTGKTLVAYVTAKKCVQNHWTFIYLDRVTGLDDAIQFAKQYMPAVIFAEDVDRVVSGQERTVEIDDILNTIDGIESKDSEIITILTSNAIETVNRAMLRPGRMDAVIEIPPPDSEAAERLMRLYGRGLIPMDANLSKAAKMLEGQIAAVIREVVERSKLFAISRQGTCEVIQGEHLEAAAFGMQKHLQLMVGTKAPEKPALEQALGKVISDTLGLNGQKEIIGETLDTIRKDAKRAVKLLGG